MTTDPSTPDPLRVVVFVDEANVFEDAKRAFGSNDPRITGRIKPMKYGRLLAERQVHGMAGQRELTQVRVYAGQPSNRHDPASYGAHRRQVAMWEKAGAKVIARPLRYPREYPQGRPEQKGVDVQIALDIVVMAIRDEYDVGILASADTDLRPALEACRKLDGRCPTLEVAAWRGDGRHANRLRLPGHRLWCHYLDLNDYRAVADRTRYTQS